MLRLRTVLRSCQGRLQHRTAAAVATTSIQDNYKFAAGGASIAAVAAVGAGYWYTGQCDDENYVKDNPAGNQHTGIRVGTNKGQREVDRRIKGAIDLPYISYTEVKKDREEYWVTWKGIVYDVTPFLKAHPGGTDRLQMAKGCDLKCFWEVYKLHYRPHIQTLIEDFRIGKLNDSDRRKMEKEDVFANMYTDEPPRPRNVVSIRSERPWNGEARLHELCDKFFTPNHLHYTRNHNPVPRVDPEDYEFTVRANPKLGLRETTLSLKQIKKLFEPTYVTTALQCAGNRQEEMVTPDRPLYVEAKWRDGAFGNAQWTGAKVRDILTYCGLDMDAMALGKRGEEGANWLNAIAMDCHETGKPYASFIPMMKVIDPFGDTILAYEMNGQELPRDHGYPIRLLAPGIAGFRNVKWCEEIGVSGPEPWKECDQKNQLFGQEISFRGHFIPGRSGKGPTPNLMGGAMIERRAGQERGESHEAEGDGPCSSRLLTYPVQSIIGYPGAFQTFDRDTKTMKVSGIAWAGSGRGIVRVEVSVDGGKNFSSARLVARPHDEKYPVPRWGYDWAWRKWEIELPLPQDVLDDVKRGKKVEVECCARAIDGDYNRQPEHVENVSNVLGKGFNHWPRKRVIIDPKYKKGDKLPTHLPTPPPGQWLWKRTYDRVDLDNNEEWLRAYEKDFVNYDLTCPPRSEWSKLSPYKKANTREGEVYYTEEEENRGSRRRGKAKLSPPFKKSINDAMPRRHNEDDTVHLNREMNEGRRVG